MPKYYIIAGCNGCGKSTLYNVAPIQKDVKYINVDKIAKEILNIKNISGKENPFTDFKRAGWIALREIDNCIVNRISFCQEATGDGLRIRKNIEDAKDNGFEIILYYVSVETSDIAIQRIASRSASGGHYVDPEKVVNRFLRRFDNLNWLLSKADRAFLYDNTEKLKLFAVYKKSKKVYEADSVPLWGSKINN